MRQLKLANFIVATVFAAFLFGAGVASADYAIAGEWYGNRGSTINIPIGQFDVPCPPATAPAIPFVTPVPASQYVPGPCGRAQKHAFTFMTGSITVPIPSTAVGVVALSGIPANPQEVLGVATTNPVALGQSFVVPPSIFKRHQASVAPVPANAFVQQLDTFFTFTGPAPIRTPSAMMPTTNPRQAPGVVGQTRRMQQNSWSKPGQTGRAAANFNWQTSELTTSVITRRVTYSANANNFGGTMGMLLDGGGTVYIVADLVTAIPGNEIALSAVGDTVPGGITVHQGRGFETTQQRSANPAPIFPTFNIPVACAPNVIPPSPVNCGLVTGIINNVPGFTTMQPLGAIPGAHTTNVGFPWTTGHVSVYAKGSQGGVAQTTTLSAVGNDSVQTGAGGGQLRTIQLVAAGIALRVGASTVRTPHLETLTIQVPEPGSTLMLAGTLGLLGGLYSVRRRFF